MASLSSATRKHLPVILIILIVILAALLLYMQYSTLRTLQEEVSLEEMELDLARARLNSLIRHSENAAQYQERLDFAVGKIPSAPSEEEVIRYLYRLAEEADLQIMDLRFENRSQGEQFTTMPLTITLEAGYQNIRRFLNLLYYGERAFRVDNLRLSRSGASENILRITLNCSTFYN